MKKLSKICKYMQNTSTCKTYAKNMQLSEFMPGGPQAGLHVAYLYKICTGDFADGPYGPVAGCQDHHD